MVTSLASKLKEIRFELLLLIAGILGFIAFFSPWAKAQKISLLAFENWQGNTVFIGSWLMIIAALIKYGAFKSETLENMDPWTDTVLGAIGAILGLIGGFTFLSEISSLYNPSYGLYTALIGGFLGLFSAIAILWAEGEYETGGMGDRRRGGRSSNGGL